MSFATDIRKWADKAQLRYEDVVSASLFQLSTSIVVMTPVLTGRARGNWFPSTGKPEDGTTQSTKADFNKIQTTTVEAVGSIFYLVNNLPYIKKLEFDGHSKQAPAGMVRVSIENFQKNLDNAINQLN